MASFFTGGKANSLNVLVQLLGELGASSFDGTPARNCKPGPWNCHAKVVDAVHHPEGQAQFPTASKSRDQHTNDLTTHASDEE